MQSSLSKHAHLHAHSQRPDEIAWELLRRLDAMVGYWDADRVCVFANEAYRSWLGRDARAVIGMHMADLLGPLYALNRPFLDAAYAGEKQVFEREIPMPDGSGVRHGLCTYTPHRKDGRVCGIFVHIANVGTLKRLEGQLREALSRAEELATHDALTGLPNRSVFEEAMRQALARAERHDEGLAVFCIDVDGFKAINDLHGHAVGDRCLVNVAARLISAFREGDTVLRLGGDEFVAIAPQIASVEQAGELAARLLAQMRPVLANWDAAPQPSVSVGVGVALYPRHGRGTEALLRAADLALYAAKRAGRNTFVLAP